MLKSAPFQPLGTLKIFKLISTYIQKVPKARVYMLRAVSCTEPITKHCILLADNYRLATAFFNQPPHSPGNLAEDYRLAKANNAPHPQAPHFPWRPTCGTASSGLQAGTDAGRHTLPASGPWLVALAAAGALAASLPAALAAVHVAPLPAARVDALDAALPAALAAAHAAPLPAALVAALAAADAALWRHVHAPLPWLVPWLPCAEPQLAARGRSAPYRLPARCQIQPPGLSQPPSCRAHQVEASGWGLSPSDEWKAQCMLGADHRWANVLEGML
eukprot:1160747-Pelagomonas_calceolata.AAC.2